MPNWLAVRLEEPLRIGPHGTLMYRRGPAQGLHLQLGSGFPSKQLAQMETSGLSHCIPSVGHHWQSISVQPLPPALTPENALTLLKKSQRQPDFTDGVEARCCAAHVAKSVIPASCVELLVPASGESTGNTHTCRLGFPTGSEARRAGSKRYE